MSQSSDKLQQSAISAVRETLIAYQDNHPSEPLIGYALITDDGLGTLGYLACSQQFVDSQDNPDLRFEAVDWPYNDGVPALDSTRDLLVASYESASSDELFGAHVRSCFRELVTALKQLRAEGVFGDEVFLTVLSTDPNDLLEELEEEAVETLNTADLAQEWRTLFE